MKTKKELDAIKKELETLNEKMKELTDEELAQVAGGISENFILRGSLIPTREHDDEILAQLSIPVAQGVIIAKSELEIDVADASESQIK